MAAQGFTHSLKKHQGLAASPKTDFRGPGCSLAWEPFNQSWRITVFHWQHFYLRSMACPSKYMASYFKEIKSELVIIYSYVCKHLLKFTSYFKKSHQYHFSRPSPLRSKKLAAHLILEGSQRGPQMRRYQHHLGTCDNTIPRFGPRPNESEILRPRSLGFKGLFR